MRFSIMAFSLLLVIACSPVPTPATVPTPTPTTASIATAVPRPTPILTRRIPVNLIPFEVVQALDGTGIDAEVNVLEKDVGRILAVTVNATDYSRTSREMWQQVSSVAHAAVDVDHRGASIDRLFVVLNTKTDSIAGLVDMETLGAWEEHRINEDQLFDAFDFRSLPPSQPAQLPNPLTNCPYGCVEHRPGCDIKGNVTFAGGEKIYHLLGSEYYDATEIDPRYGERWFCTEAEAIASGWRKSSR